MQLFMTDSFKGKPNKVRTGTFRIHRDILLWRPGFCFSGHVLQTVMVSFEFPVRSGVEVRAKGAPSQYDKIAAKFVYFFGVSYVVN